MATRKVRYKKLSIKTALPVLREDQVDPNEYEALTTETQIATGVEQAEENEYHLQVVLQAAASSEKEIPVPPPEESDINYDELYARKFREPTNYIRFSQTVEECIGCQYDMTEEDDEFLRQYNQKRSAASRLSEDDFEQIMEVFEDTASISTPYASVDKTIVPYDHMVGGLASLQVPKVMIHAKELYEYWKSRRGVVGGSLHPNLKFETHQDSDEMDPFVCFRRREVRQTRKTRARDMQSADKLKKLRRELEEGRQLVLLAHEREHLKRDLLRADRAIFEQRARLKEMKIRLGIKENDEDLINQKAQKKRAVDMSVAQRAQNTQVRAPPRNDGRSTELDLVQLLDSLVEREKELRAEVIKSIEKHRRWNENHIDLTCEPLGPVKDQSAGAGFRPAKTQYLMTPPASESSHDDEAVPMDVDEPEPSSAVFRFRGLALDSSRTAAQQQPPRHRFRRRIGRLNRLWIDRRRMPMSPPCEVSPTLSLAPAATMDVDAGSSDRWKYDHDDDESDGEPEAFVYDPYDIEALKFRAAIPLSLPFVLRRADPSTSSGVVRSGGAQQLPGRQAVQAPLPPPSQQQRLPAATATAPASSST